MILRTSAIGLVVVAAAAAMNISNTNLTATSSAAPVEVLYSGLVDVDASGQIVSVEGILVDTSISESVGALLEEARDDGINLGGWGWRSHQRQHELRLINGCPDGWVHRPDEQISDFAPASQCRVPTARPGVSMHEVGLAIDFTCNGRQIANTNCFRWLQANAARFGLFNLPSEPWHWSVNGR